MSDCSLSECHVVKINHLVSKYLLRVMLCINLQVFILLARMFLMFDFECFNLKLVILQSEARLPRYFLQDYLYRLYCLLSKAGKILTLHNSPPTSNLYFFKYHALKSPLLIS